MFFFSTVKKFSFLFRVISGGCFFLLSPVLLSAEYVAKIGSVEISAKEFQEFIDVQKFLIKEDSIKALLDQKGINRNTLLKAYIDQKLLLLEAEKGGYGVSSTVVRDRYSLIKDKWINNLYITRHVDLFDIKVGEKDLEQEYKALPQLRKQKKYSSLNTDEKKRLQQMVFLKKGQEKKRAFQKELEKKYSVKRFKSTDKTVAQVGNFKILRSELDKLLDAQLSRLGLSRQQIKKQDAKRFKEVEQDLLEELILEELIRLAIKDNKFNSQPLVKKAAEIYKATIAVEVFMEKELAPKVEISDQEIDAAYVQLSKQNPALQKMLPTEQEKYLKTFIVQRKLPLVMNEFVSEKKEQLIIKRNKKALAAIK